MKLIKLTQGQVTMVDDDMYEELNNYKWYANWIPHAKKFYVARNVYDQNGKRTKLQMHRRIMSASQYVVIDRKNGDPLDNQISNLQITTCRGNLQNLHIQKTSNYPGVYWDKNAKKWRARIWIANKKMHLGYFEYEQDAFSAYLKACDGNSFSTDFMLEKFGIEKKAMLIL